MKTKKIIIGLWLITFIVEISLAIASYIYSIPLSTYILLAILIAALNFMLISVIDTSNWNDRDFMEYQKEMNKEYIKDQEWIDELKDKHP